mmetsp:Transcript_16075/g.43827  ORF Transcript_16075/g.43827 Transcript_16075/m.43827 type:complete len:109 (+) Transcript_16075:1923-2249(+)
MSHGEQSINPGHTQERPRKRTHSQAAALQPSSASQNLCCSWWAGRILQFLHTCISHEKHAIIPAHAHSLFPCACTAVLASSSTKPCHTHPGQHAQTAVQACYRSPLST